MKILDGFQINHSLIRDPIYGFIELPAKLKPILDHQLVQRLRRVSQSPLQDMVYPSANHTRFEHSLGCMYLSIFSITTLIENSKDKILHLINNDTILQNIVKEEEKIAQLILAAAAIGLLHDIGHGPFSHTLEDSISYYNKKLQDTLEENINEIPQYEHERIGKKLCQIILDDYSRLVGYGYFLELAIKVLGKKYESDLQIVLSSLIDSNIIDVDKGDYLLRDSYHCGTSYGKYDFFRLWKNIILLEKNGKYQIAVKEKAASEVWSLQIARYVMYLNVYEHHIREITDATLSEIIHEALLNNISIVPYDKNNNLDIEKFIQWGDDSLFAELSKHKKLKNKINSFLNRKIFKRTTNAKITKDINLLKLKEDLLGALNQYDIKKNDLLLHATKERAIAPVFEKNIQTKKIIFTKKENIVSIAEYFNFKLDDEKQIQEKNKYKLSIFVNKEKLEKNKINIIQVIENFLIKPEDKLFYQIDTF